MIARGVLAASVTALLVFAFGLITASTSSWWFDAAPWMRQLATWVRASNPWDFFVIVFIVINGFHYVQVVQGVFIDRYNLRALVELSRTELSNDTASKPNANMYRALLGGRRRLLESVIRFDPAQWALGALILSFVLLGHTWSALVILAFGLFITWFIPRMIMRFTQRREKYLTETRARLELKPNERPKDPVERVERSIENTAERLTVFVNRPLERFRVGWPVLVGAAGTVAAVATLTIADMQRASELPSRATLLILMLVLTARVTLSSAQHSEDLAFFASALAEIEESEDGTETL
jgi:hypothetical protein